MLDKEVFAKVTSAEASPVDVVGSDNAVTPNTGGLRMITRNLYCRAMAIKRQSTSSDRASAKFLRWTFGPWLAVALR